MNIIRFRSVIAIFISAISVAYLSCSSNPPSNISGASLIPKPVSVTNSPGWFMLESDAAVYVSSGSDELMKTGNYLAEKLRPATGYKIDVKATDKTPGAGNIFITLAASEPKLGNEGYELVITDKKIVLSANKPEGIFNGIQTLRQLFPSSVELATRQAGPWKVASGTIVDYPEYPYRGVMLDVARHFFGVNEVKQYIDLLACYKINALHLHLSDDQGWRIEIKSWPQLALHGGSTQVGGGNGGYYTQEQYSDLVKYAADRYITIIPEIDMPGHINAALSSYPELNMNNKVTELYRGTEVGFSTIDTKKEVSL